MRPHPYRFTKAEIYEATEYCKCKNSSKKINIITDATIHFYDYAKKTQHYRLHKDIHNSKKIVYIAIQDRNEILQTFTSIKKVCKFIIGK